MEWSAESIEKVICLMCRQPNLQENSMQETWASFLLKFLDCVSPPLQQCLARFFAHTSIDGRLVCRKRRPSTLSR